MAPANPRTPSSTLAAPRRRCRLRRRQPAAAHPRATTDITGTTGSNAGRRPKETPGGAGERAFVASLPAPNSSGATSNAPGAALFATLGCATCHTPSLPAGDTQAQHYSDQLPHDKGPSLDDGVVQGQARGRDWRTTPLWGLGVRVRYLHDGRATSLTAAIAAHEGEAMRSANAFRALSADAKEKLLNFLGSL